MATNRAKGACCVALSLVLGSKVSFPASQDYDASLGSYFSEQEAAVHPRCIVSPQSALDVSVAVATLTKTAALLYSHGNSDGSIADQAVSGDGSSSGACQFAVRSGGHAGFPGAANIEGGVTIDLSGLNQITLLHGRSNGSDDDDADDYDSDDSDKAAAPVGPVSVGAGAKWGDVYTFLDAQSLTVAGGRASSIGVGGLSLGGGISFLGPRAGWTCDTVVDFEVVLANGSIIHANQHQHADLLWGLRGGTNNLGIVTTIALQTFTQGQIWGGFVTTPYSTADEQVAALAQFSEPTTYDEYASLLTTFAYSGARDMQVIVNNMEYTRAVASPPVYQQLAKLPALASTQRLTNMSDLAAETEKAFPKGMRQLTATITIRSTADAINATVQAWNASVPLVRHVPGVVWAISMDPIPVSMFARHASDNALGLADRSRDQALIVVMATMSWSRAQDDELAGRTVKDLVATIRRNVDRLGALDPFIYANYAAPWQDPFRGYGAAAVDRLVAIRREYDPTGVFSRQVPGGFKLEAR